MTFTILFQKIENNCHYRMIAAPLININFDFKDVYSKKQSVYYFNLLEKTHGPLKQG